MELPVFAQDAIEPVKSGVARRGKVSLRSFLVTEARRETIPQALRASSLYTREPFTPRRGCTTYYLEKSLPKILF